MKKIKTIKRFTNILISTATHGDEKIGLLVQEKIERIMSAYPLVKGTIKFIIANPQALEKGVRYIDTDLNRSFPGKSSGSYEERLAAKLLPKIHQADIVIDIHSTKSALKDALIVTKYDSATRRVVDMIKPKNLLIMEATQHNALISNARIGIAFEYGKDDDCEVIKKTTDDIIRLIVALNMMSTPVRKKINSTKVFRVYSTFPKNKGDRLSLAIKNYCKVKKGSVIARASSQKIRADEDFYPILFGQKNYKDIFGFIAKRVS